MFNFAFFKIIFCMLLQGRLDIQHFAHWNALTQYYLRIMYIYIYSICTVTYIYICHMTILYYIIMFILDAHAGAEMCQVNILSSFSCLLVRFGACVFFIFSPAPPIATSPAAACPYAPAKQQKRVNLQESTTWSALRQKGISMDFKWFPPLLRCCWLAEHWN